MFMPFLQQDECRCSRCFNYPNHIHGNPESTSKRYIGLGEMAWRCCWETMRTRVWTQGPIQQVCHPTHAGNTGSERSVCLSWRFWHVNRHLYFTIHVHRHSHRYTFWKIEINKIKNNCYNKIFSFAELWVFCQLKPLNFGRVMSLFYLKLIFTTLWECTDNFFNNIPIKEL